jgi:hypothetical protein
MWGCEMVGTNKPIIIVFHVGIDANLYGPATLLGHLVAIPLI